MTRLFVYPYGVSSRIQHRNASWRKGRRARCSPDANKAPLLVAQRSTAAMEPRKRTSDDAAKPSPETKTSTATTPNERWENHGD